MKRLLQRPARLAVLPNDAAFPYDRLTGILHAMGRPFLLQQEGIRFPLPAAESGVVYGSGGAAAIAAWGKTSVRYFLDAGGAAEQAHAVGSPRFDAVGTADWSEAGRSVRARLGLEGPTLLLLSNPIDAQGFCTGAEKLELVRGFVAGISPLLEANEIQLVLKLHAGEREEDFRSALAHIPGAGRIVWAGSEALYPLCAAADGAVVLASTVGLEALLFDLPLGVLEIPGHGFVHDYVEAGAALGIGRGDDVAEKVRFLLSGWRQESSKEVSSYLAASLANRGASARAVADLVYRLAEGGS